MSGLGRIWFWVEFWKACRSGRIGMASRLEAMSNTSSGIGSMLAESTITCYLPAGCFRGVVVWAAEIWRSTNGCNDLSRETLTCRLCDLPCTNTASNGSWTEAPADRIVHTVPTYCGTCDRDLMLAAQISRTGHRSVVNIESCFLPKCGRP